MIVLSHPTGNANVRAVADAFLRHRILFRFATCIAFAQQSTLPGTLARRTFDIPREKLWLRPVRETVRHVASKLGLQFLVAHEHGWASIDAVGRDLDRSVARKIQALPDGEITSVYCYEDFALNTFEIAKRRGARCIYDVPIAAWELSQRLLREQAERWPAWEPTLLGTRDSAEKLQRKQRELELSDMIVTPSKFVLDSLPPAIRAEKQCILAEFGSPSLAAPPDGAPVARRRLRLLFAGAMTQRKGLADLFAAMKLVDSETVELVVIGSRLMPMSFYHEAFARFTYEPPREQAAVFDLMRSCDVLVLPSIVEGRALVQQEAMACGLPLIVTRNAGGEDLIGEGKTGFLVPPNSPESIAEKISWFVEHRSELPAMSAAARAKAAELTWSGYGDKIVHAIAA
jgi:glycosyltransferase involved in cell wall biosynthesis